MSAQQEADSAAGPAEALFVPVRGGRPASGGAAAQGTAIQQRECRARVRGQGVPARTGACGGGTICPTAAAGIRRAPLLCVRQCSQLPSRPALRPSVLPFATHNPRYRSVQAPPLRAFEPATTPLPISGACELRVHRGDLCTNHFVGQARVDDHRLTREPLITGSEGGAGVDSRRAGAGGGGSRRGQ